MFTACVPLLSVVLTLLIGCDATPKPTVAPTFTPTVAPTRAPTGAPTVAPTVAPTASPTVSPTEAPTEAPTRLYDTCPFLANNATGFGVVVQQGSINPSGAINVSGSVAANISVVFSSGQLVGDIHAPSISLGSVTQTGSQLPYDAAASNAYSALSQLFLELHDKPCSEPITSESRAFTTPGVYCYGANYLLPLSFTFNAQNDSSAVYVLQFAGNIQGTTGGTMTLLNGARACNIFFAVVGNMAPAGTNTLFGQFLVAGNINPPSDLILQGKLVALGAFDPVSNTTAGNGNVNPGGALRLTNCECSRGPTGAPTPAPTNAPTPPTAAPTQAPTEAPTAAPTEAPTVAPTTAPTIAPTIAPTEAPTGSPTVAPTRAPTPPTQAPTEAPTSAPTEAPTSTPTAAPTRAPTPPTEAPTTAPTRAPTPPTEAPTIAPTVAPTEAPTAPTEAPTEAPTSSPTAAPTSAPSAAPTASPTASPTVAPTTSPTRAPTTSPTASPSEAPTEEPTELLTPEPTVSPTDAPTRAPTQTPTRAPTRVPTEEPTESPTEEPTAAPTDAPTHSPTRSPTVSPTRAPSAAPTVAPSAAPTVEPTGAPIGSPPTSAAPTSAPTTAAPTVAPTTEPTQGPTRAPTEEPTAAPTRSPTRAPSDAPTRRPTSAPTEEPTEAPVAPTGEPTTAAPTPFPPLFCPRETAEIGDFALLTQQGNVNPASATEIVGHIGAENAVALRSGDVRGNIYSSLIELGAASLEGRELPYNDAAQSAYMAAVDVYQRLAALPCDAEIDDPNQTFVSGPVYCYRGSLRVAEYLNFTFDGRDDPTTIFVLHIHGNIQGKGGQMNLINGALACNIFVVIEGSLQPLHTTMLYGIWLVAGDVIPVGNLSVQGKLVALGPFVQELLTQGNSLGQGNINPSGTLAVVSCQCFTGLPTVAPTTEPISPPTTGSWVAIGFCVAFGVAALVYSSVMSLLALRRWLRRRRLSLDTWPRSWRPNFSLAGLIRRRWPMPPRRDYEHLR